jgi:hypothetical protein
VVPEDPQTAEARPEDQEDPADQAHQAHQVLQAHQAPQAHHLHPPLRRHLGPAMGTPIIQPPEIPKVFLSTMPVPQTGRARLFIKSLIGQNPLQECHVAFLGRDFDGVTKELWKD